MSDQSTTNESEERTQAAAGRRGDEVRSDVFVSIELRDGDGITIDVQSKAAALYEEAIRSDVSKVLTAFGVHAAAVRVEDQGALPFVIAARTEAALRRLGLDADGRPGFERTKHVRSAPDRLRRSRLYLPGNEPKFMINAALHRPDAVILDLEDSVHPDQKDAARLVVRNALRTVDFGGCERMVRINQGELGLSDLDAVVPESPDLILIPKVEGREAVLRVDERVRTNQKEIGDDDPIWLMPILESGLGIEKAFEIATSSDRIVALTIGLEDYTADLGVPKTPGGDESLYARTRLVNAAAAAHIQAIDSVYGDVSDMEGLRTWATRSRALGFQGMGCIHPRQIPQIHECFAPSAAEIDKALRIVEAFRDAQARGLGVVSLGSRMIDPPVVLRARRLVDAAVKAGLVSEEAVSS